MKSDNKNAIEHSISLAEKTIDWIKEQSIGAAPSNFEIGYHYHSGKHPDIEQTLNKTSATGDKLQNLLDQLYHEYLANPADSKLLNQFQNDLQQIIKDAADTLNRSEKDMGHYNEALEFSLANLDEGDSLENIKSVVNGLVRETQLMRKQVRGISSDLKSCSDEITELKSQFEQVRNEVFIDPLTGVYNRRGLEKHLQRLLGQLTKQDSLSFLMVDIDHFKAFNDTHGHLVGDQVICFVARMIQRNIRGADEVARYGGEEFAVLLPDTDADDALKVAENLRSCIHKSVLTRRSSGEKLGKISVSIGVSAFRHGEPMNDLINRADKALYLSKQKGRNCCTADF